MELFNKIVDNPHIYYPMAAMLVALAWWSARGLSRGHKVAARGLSFGVLLGSIPVAAHALFLFPAWLGLLSGTAGVASALFTILLWSLLPTLAAVLFEEESRSARRVGAVLFSLPLLALALLLLNRPLASGYDRLSGRAAERERVFVEQQAVQRRAMARDNAQAFHGVPAPEGLLTDTPDGYVVGRTPERDVAYITAPLQRTGVVLFRTTSDAADPSDDITLTNLGSEQSTRIGPMTGGLATLPIMPGDVLLIGRRSMDVEVLAPDVRMSPAEIIMSTPDAAPAPAAAVEPAAAPATRKP